MRMGGEWNMENAVPAAVTGDGQDADELFRSLGCDYIQGYYYSKPLPEQTFLDNVARWHESGDDCGLQIKCALRV